MKPKLNNAETKKSCHEFSFNPRTFSCALDRFLEIASYLFLPHFSNLTVRNEFTELPFNTCSRYIESQENSKLLEEIKEPLWAYSRQQCPSSLARDCNACFSQIFDERTFGKLTPDEMNIFSSLRTFQSFWDTCQKDVVLNSSILVNFVTRSALQKCELNYNSWPQFVLKNKRLFPIHCHFGKYSPVHFIKKAGAALVETTTSLYHMTIGNRQKALIRIPCKV